MRTISLIPLILLSFLTATSYTQYKLDWVISATDDRKIIDVLSNSLGDVYITGYFYDTIDADPGIDTAILISKGINDIFIEKLDSAGHFVWAESFGDNSYDAGGHLLLDNAGNIYCSGNFNNTIDFDPGPDIVNKTSFGGGLSSDIFILKLDSDGNFIWVKTVGNSGDGCSARGMDIDENGDIYVTTAFTGTLFTGAFSVTSDDQDGLIMKFNGSTGAMIWDKQIGGSDYQQSDKIVVWGNMLVVNGNFYGTTDFNPGPGTFNLTSFGDEDPYLLKLDIDGNFKWAGHIGTSGFDPGGNFEIDSAGCIYFAQQYLGTSDMDFGPGVYNLTSTGFIDVSLEKIDTANNLVWAESFGSPLEDRLEQINIDHDNNIILGGSFEGIVDFDPGVATRNYTSLGGLDAFFAKFNTNGQFLFASILRSSGEQYPPSSLAFEENGSMYASGYFRDTIDFDPQINVFSVVDSVDELGSYLLKFYPMPCDVYYVENDFTICAGEAIFIGDSIYIDSGYHTNIFNGYLGCDSVIVTHINVVPEYVETIIYNICDGENIMVGDSIYSVTGIYTNLFESASGCDSAVISNLTVHSPFYVVIYDTICQGESIIFNFEEITQEGLYFTTFSSIFGCDSSVELHVFLDTVDVSISATETYLTANLSDAIYQWITCPVFEAIDGATSQSFHPTTSGNYAVMISHNGCTDTSECYTIDLVSTLDINPCSDITLSPNPVSSELIIKFTNPEWYTFIQIIDLSGKVLHAENISRISMVRLDITQYPAGMYVMKVFDGEGLKSFKFVKD